MEKVISVLGMNLSLAVSPPKTETLATLPSGKQHSPRSRPRPAATPQQSSTQPPQAIVPNANPFSRPTYRYDLQGRPIEVRYADGTYQTFAYDGRDNLIRRQTAAGRVLHYTYDTRNRLRRLSDDRGHTTYTDYGPGWVRFTTPTCATSIQFDGQQRIAAIQQTLDTIASRTEYRYDEAGRCVGLRPPGSQQWLTYIYETNAASNSESNRQSSPDSQPLHLQAEDGTHYATLCGRTIHFANGTTRQQDVDEEGMPDRIAIGISEGQSLVDWSYHYRHMQIQQWGQHRFTYDDDGQLASWHRGPQSTHYTYDERGNRLTVEDETGLTRYTYDPSPGRGDRLRQLTGPDGSTVEYDYDLDGNRIARRSGDKIDRYTYDAEGRLIAFHPSSGPTVEYTYDGLGRRVKRQSGDRITYFHYDCNDQLLTETDECGQVTATYLWVGWQCLGCIRGAVGASTVEFYGTDHLGSVWAISDETGKLTWREEPSPFGETAGPWFIRKPWDADLGCYDFGTRFYEPQVGRFLTPDSYTFAPDDWRLLFQPERDFWGERKPQQTALHDWLQTSHSQNRYIYCLNDPINNIDLDGHSAWWFFLTIPSSLTWALPNTSLGLILVLSNLLMEIVGWLIWVFIALFRWDADPKWYPWGRLNPANPFDTDERAHFWLGLTASARQGVPWTLLNGSFFVWRPFTMGNIVYIEDSMDNGKEADTRSRFIVPKAPDVQLTRQIALHSHEMQHVFQYALLGPLFHALPVPLILRLIAQEDLSEGDKWWEKISIGGLTWLVGGILWAVTGGSVDPDDVQNWVNPSTWWSSILPYKWVSIISNAWDLNNWVPGLGIYEWDMIINGGQTNSALERNAGAHSGDVYKTVVEAEKSEVYVGEFTRVIGADVVYVPDPGLGGLPNPITSVTFAIAPVVNDVPVGAAMAPGTLDPQQLPHSIDLDRNNVPPVQVVNGSGFYFHSLAAGTFTVTGTGSATGRTESVEIVVKGIEVSPENPEVFVCQRQKFEIKGDAKATYKLRVKAGSGTIEADGLTYTASDTAGTETLEAIANYPPANPVFSTYGDNGLATAGPAPRDYVVKEFDVTVKEPTITPDTEEIFVGGTVNFAIDYLPANATITVGEGNPPAVRVPGSQFNRPALQFIAGKGPIGARETEKITFSYGCKDYSFEIEVKPIVAAIAPAILNQGETAQITVTEGVPPFRYAIVVANSNGASVDSNGLYTAGTVGAQVTDTIAITARNGAGGRARIDVTIRP